MSTMPTQPRSMSVDQLLEATPSRSTALPVSGRNVGMQRRAHGTCFDETRGCLGGEDTAIVTYTAEGHISRYDIGQLHRLGVVGVLRGTLLDSPFLWLQLLFMVALMFAITYSHVTFHRMQGRSSDERVEIAQAHLSSVESLLRPMQAITAFFLGLFVSLVLGRWSTLSQTIMAGLIGAAVNLSACAGHMYAGNDAHSRAMRRRTLRYLCLAFSLVFSEARREVDLQPFVEADMLMPEERKVLEALPQRAQAVCGWLWHHFHVAALDDKRPYAKNVSTFQWQGQLFAFRRMIADCHMYVGVQLPLPYAAFLTLVVKATMAVTVLNAALDVVVAFEEGDKLSIISQTVQVCLWATVYQACLDMHTVLCNPFGYDAADFPQSDHFHTLASGCYAQLESETLIADHVEGLSGAASAGVGKSGLPKEVERELRMMTAADEEEWLTPDGKVDLAKFLAAHEGGRIDGVALHRAQSTVRKQARGRAQMGSKRSFLPMR